MPTPDATPRRNLVPASGSERPAEYGTCPAASIWSESLAGPSSWSDSWLASAADVAASAAEGDGDESAATVPEGRLADGAVAVAAAPGDDPDGDAFPDDAGGAGVAAAGGGEDGGEGGGDGAGEGAHAAAVAAADAAAPALDVGEGVAAVAVVDGVVVAAAADVAVEVVVGAVRREPDWSAVPRRRARAGPFLYWPC